MFKEIFFLDTNTLIHDPWGVLDAYSHGMIVLSVQVIEELDNKKGSRKKGAQKVMWQIEYLQRAERLIVDKNDYRNDLGALWEGKPDNLILCSALAYRRCNQNHKVVLVTNDVFLREKALAFGLETHGHKQKNPYDFEAGLLTPHRETFITRSHKKLPNTKKKKGKKKGNKKKKGRNCKKHRRR